jgi:uncharacterized protein (TIGR02246 family)
VFAQTSRAWADGDGEAFAAWYTPDATVILPGVYRPGQDAIREAMAAAFAGPLKNTRRSHQVRSIGFTGPGTAIVITDSVTVPLCCGQRTARPLNHFLAHKRSRRRRRTHGHHAPAAAESR